MKKTKKLTCDICGKIFVNSTHLKKHDIEDVEKYYLNLLFSQYDYDVDGVVEKYQFGFSVDDLIVHFNYSRVDLDKILKYKNIKIRTQSESKLTKKYKTKYTDTIINKYGVDNISKLDVIKDKKKSTMLKNYNRVNNFNNDDIRNYALGKIDYELAYKLNINAIFKKYGVDNISKVDFVKKKISASQLERFSHLSADEKRELTKICRSFIKHKKISKLELRIQEILNDFNIGYKCNFFIKGFFVDLVFDNKIILEIMGDFWHGNPNKYKSTDFVNLPGGKVLAESLWIKDKNKKIILEKSGYSVYYLWEDDINKMSDIDIINFMNFILKNK